MSACQYVGYAYKRDSHLSASHQSTVNLSTGSTMNALTICLSFGLILCAAVAQGGLILGHADELISSPAQYEFHYAVHDSHTGDVKDQFEHRRGGYVTGRYSLIEPDGQRRIVDYSADPLLGFNAQVRREPSSIITRH